ncbi:hypothetical protein YH65_10530 [Sulfurovum lithotrophicum]|uniref:Uncharacterized protein n=1 Tax=Sulfurovum lithotrophicum TaxID=206403 RepID=A0A7U4M2Q0_9BACT|nr:hypothetical protein [Sulfurovum lithotrophicum]AKF25773.1 hypothetical protein YH65_10530 [Sulfurovum lithotrophicum]
MDNNHSEGHDGDLYAWNQRKAASELASSEGSMDEDRKEMIRRALDFDIMDVRTYRGYKGDLLLEIITMHPEEIESLKKIAEKLGFETVTKKDIIDEYKLFCISPATDIYELKTDA